MVSVHLNALAFERIFMLKKCELFYVLFLAKGDNPLHEILAVSMNEFDSTCGA